MNLFARLRLKWQEFQDKLDEAEDELYGPEPCRIFVLPEDAPILTPEQVMPAKGDDDGPFQKKEKA